MENSNLNLVNNTKPLNVESQLNLTSDFIGDSDNGSGEVGPSMLGGSNIGDDSSSTSYEAEISNQVKFYEDLVSVVESAPGVGVISQSKDNLETIKAKIETLLTYWV